MDFKQFLVTYGLNTYRTTIFIPIPTGAQVEIQLPKQTPTNIGRIFGLSIYADTVAPDNSPLITTAQAQLLYLTFKDASTEFWEKVRLDDLLFNFAGVPTPSGERFYDVNLPGQFDLSTSFITNPTGIISAAAPAAPTQIALNVHYISRQSYHKLLNAGIVLDEVNSYKGQMKSQPAAQL